MLKTYSIEYTYEGQKADKSFHFVQAKSERVARVMTEEYLENYLTRRFKKGNIPFEIKKVELVTEDLSGEVK